MEEWAQDASPLRREAVARISRDPALLRTLARDPSRQVRRAVASNRFAPDDRARLATEDAAPEVRLRAAEARLEDRMMVSAVKAWRFKPAVKDGQPVRYRVRIPISK